MIVKDKQDLDGLKEIGAICRMVLQDLAKRLDVGVTARALDARAAALFDRHGARSAPVLAYDFPGQTCISVGTAIAHGIPDDRPFKAGQLVNIDVSAEKNGYFADCGASFAVGQASLEAMQLLRATEKAQWQAMQSVRAGMAINEVGRIVEQIARSEGFQVVEGLNGHGVGRWIHEDPVIPNKYDPRERGVFEAGMVVTIEPFLATRTKKYFEKEDGWTLCLDGGGLGAQFEHSFIVTDDAPIVLTL